MKYTSEQLKTMALEALEAKHNRDPRYFQLVMTISMVAGMQPSEVEARIMELAV